jgi:hypothetical protein
VSTKDDGGGGVGGVGGVGYRGAGNEECEETSEGSGSRPQNSNTSMQGKLEGHAMAPF